MEACREVAQECRVPLVDHFAKWTEAEAKGQKLADWTTDLCHPNPQGHETLAVAMLPALLGRLRSNVGRAGFQVKLETLMEHDDGKFLWFHPRPAAMPGLGKHGRPAVLVTLQQHLLTSDHYSGSSVMRTDDLGASWSGPTPQPELGWVKDGDVDIAVADVTPGWHAATKKVIAVGAQVRYSRDGAQLEDQPRAHQTAYAVFDPQTNRWTGWRRLEMPEAEMFNFARSACAQFVVEPDGALLLPFYIGKSAKDRYATTVVRCSFDGETLKYVEHGDVLALDVARGLYEPSLVRCGGEYYLTIRNDEKGYVTCGADGLHYRPVKPWLFDDGQELGSYNTQQHWLAHGDALFLAYTRRGANNDHIPRHRAPLFLAQVDRQRLEVLRDMEQTLMPERGAMLGNFGAAPIDERQSWVTDSEGVFSDDARRRGAKGATFLARVIWNEPAAKNSEPDPSASASGAARNATPPSVLPRALAKLLAAEPVKIVCFGDSVTGVYYHTGGRRAYTDMLGVALGRAIPAAKEKLSMINAGISGNTTASALARIDRDVLGHKPTLVTVMFGLNDMNALSLEQYRANLTTIVEKCRAAGADVLLCTPNNVIDTAGRPTARLEQYCEAMREVGRATQAPVCDCYAELQAFRQRDAKGWRLLMSDAIHPNMDGHKRIAETIARSIAGRQIDLADVPPPERPLAKTLARVKSGAAVKVLAMTPAADAFAAAFKQSAPEAKLEITPWDVAGKSLAEIEADAQARVRPMKPDLVVVSVPRASKFDGGEAFIHSYAWIMNWSLSFGVQEWDCVVVHPAVVDPAGVDAAQDALIRRLVAAQDLSLIDRAAGDARPAAEIIAEWLKQQ
jgi:lysophospholipase L1-like esterase